MAQFDDIESTSKTIVRWCFQISTKIPTLISFPLIYAGFYSNWIFFKIEVWNVVLL